MQPPPEPPPQYAAYPRGNAVYGSADQLQALMEGYFGLNIVFGINVALALGMRVATSSATDPGSWMLLVVGAVLVVGLAIGFLTYPHNKKIGYGANWSPAGPVIASVLMGLNSALCCGIIGYIVVQSLAAQEIKKYGIKGGVFGLKKRDIEPVVAQLRTQERGWSTPAPPSPAP